jgi:hypothetical protein
MKSTTAAASKICRTNQCVKHPHSTAVDGSVRGCAGGCRAAAQPTLTSRSSNCLSMSFHSGVPADKVPQVSCQGLAGADACRAC